MFGGFLELILAVVLFAVFAGKIHHRLVFLLSTIGISYGVPIILDRLMPPALSLPLLRFSLFPGQGALDATIHPLPILHAAAIAGLVYALSLRFRTAKPATET